MICPNCSICVDINCKESSHQVNDNDGETYCSYECSAVGTLRFLADTNKDLPFEELSEIIGNT